VLPCFRLLQKYGALALLEFLFDLRPLAAKAAERQTMVRLCDADCPQPEEQRALELERRELPARSASLVRIRPELNEKRFYRMEIWPDLFGRVLLMRQWGRIGSEGRRRLDPYPDHVAALDALAAIETAKRRRGYRDRRSPPTAQSSDRCSSSAAVARGHVSTRSASARCSPQAQISLPSLVIGDPKPETG
jgi:predicted DNA-binding WGR domain protein